MCSLILFRVPAMGLCTHVTGTGAWTLLRGPDMLMSLCLTLHDTDNSSNKFLNPQWSSPASSWTTCHHPRPNIGSRQWFSELHSKAPWNNPKKWQLGGYETEASARIATETIAWIGGSQSTESKRVCANNTKAWEWITRRHKGVYRLNIWSQDQRGRGGKDSTKIRNHITLYLPKVKCSTVKCIYLYTYSLKFSHGQKMFPRATDYILGKPSTYLLSHWSE